MRIPENYLEFLHWFKQETEKAWASPSIQSDKDDYWIYGAKWLGLEESYIEAIEKKYKIAFTQEHKGFLKVLHAIDKKQAIQYYGKNGDVHIKDRPFFYNWLKDDEEIKNYLERPHREILRDIKKSGWLKSWGKRPNTEKEIEEIFTNWYAKAPKLLPIHAHRFVVSDLNNLQNPILSVWGTDTIIYGWDMRHYLLNELGGYLDLHELVYDEEDQEWYPESIQELKNLNNKAWAQSKYEDIAYWGELVEYFGNGWTYTPG